MLHHVTSRYTSRCITSDNEHQILQITLQIALYSVYALFIALHHVISCYITLKHAGLRYITLHRVLYCIATALLLSYTNITLRI